MPDGVVPIRVGDHAGFVRIVFDVDDGGSVPVERTGDLLIIHLQSPSLSPVGRPPRNVRSLRSDPDSVAIEIMPGAGIRRMIVNNHLVIDVLDPPTAQATQPPQRVVAPIRPTPIARATPMAEVTPSLGVPGVAARPGSDEPALDAKARPAIAASDVRRLDVALTPVKPPIVTEIKPPASPPLPVEDKVAAPLLVPEAKPQRDNVPDPLSARVFLVNDPGPGHTFVVPFPANVGAAAFRRGADVIVVFDERKPIMLEGLKGDSVFGSVTVQLLPAATVMTIPLALPFEVRLEHRPAGWRVTAIGGNAAPAALRSIVPELSNGHVSLSAEAPGLVVSVSDAATGDLLLVGTQRQAGQGVPVTRRSPDFTLLPTWQGVVLQALSDTVALRATTSGFEIAADSAGNALSSSQQQIASGAAAEASQMTRAFDIPNLHTDGLLRRMQGAVVAASATPLQTRGDARRDVAASMIALGLGVEAQSVLGLAALGDARTDGQADTRGLSAIAGLLAGRLAEADGLDDPRLDGTDEIAFWRGVRLAMRPGNEAAAAQVFAGTTPLLLSYPAELQNRLLPKVAETMALGGQSEAAKQLLDTRKLDPLLDLARAYLREATDADPAEALAILDRLSQSPDRLVRFNAVRHAVELRLARGLATPSQAADTLGKMLFAWRGDEREIELRLRVAQLLADSKQWRQALALLRETVSGWPDQSAGSCPAPWCSNVAAEQGWLLVQAARGGRLTARSSLSGAIVSSVI